MTEMSLSIWQSVVPSTDLLCPTPFKNNNQTRGGNRNVPLHWTRGISEISNRNGKRPLKSRFGHFTANDKVDKLWFAINGFRLPVCPYLALQIRGEKLSSKLRFIETEFDNQSLSSDEQGETFAVRRLISKRVLKKLFYFSNVGLRFFRVQKNLEVNHLPLERGLAVQT